METDAINFLDWKFSKDHPCLFTILVYFSIVVRQGSPNEKPHDSFLPKDAFFQDWLKLILWFWTKTNKS